MEILVYISVSYFMAVLRLSTKEKKTMREVKLKYLWINKKLIDCWCWLFIQIGHHPKWSSRKKNWLSTSEMWLTRSQTLGGWVMLVCSARATGVDATLSPAESDEEHCRLICGSAISVVRVFMIKQELTLEDSRSQ